MTNVTQKTKKCNTNETERVDSLILTKFALQVAIAFSVIITASARFYYEGFQWYYYLIFATVWIPLWILYDLNEHKRKQND